MEALTPRTLVSGFIAGSVAGRVRQAALSGSSANALLASFLDANTLWRERAEDSAYESSGRAS